MERGKGPGGDWTAGGGSLAGSGERGTGSREGRGEEAVSRAWTPDRGRQGGQQAWQRRKWEVLDGVEGAGAQTAVTANTGTRGAGSATVGTSRQPRAVCCSMGMNRNEMLRVEAGWGWGSAMRSSGCQQEGVVGRDKEGARGRHSGDRGGQTGRRCWAGGGENEWTRPGGTGSVWTGLLSAWQGLPGQPDPGPGREPSPAARREARGLTRKHRGISCEAARAAAPPAPDPGLPEGAGRVPAGS